MIKSKDISVIVQGAINKTETIKCLKSIKKHLPEAEIILSTWNGSDVNDLEGLFDIVLYNTDPSATVQYEYKNRLWYNNLNRQLLSTQEGLKKATCKYAMKLRSDLILSSNKFLNYFDKFQERSENYNLFERKILTSTLFTRFKYKTKNGDFIEMPFHVSDWWFFGLRKDLNKYFLNTPLVEEPYFTKYFELEENLNKKSPYGETTYKFAPEQYFGYECFARNFDDIYMEDAADSNDELIKIFEKCLINNFIVLEYKQSGIYLNKYLYSKNEVFSGDQYIGLYSFYRYEETYKRLCDNNYMITADGYIFQNEKYGYDLLRVYKHIFSLIDPKSNITKRLEQLFWGIPISLISFFIKHYKEILRGRK